MYSSLKVWFGQSTPFFPCPWSINCSIDVGTACLGPLWWWEPLIYDYLTKTPNTHSHFRTSIAFNRNLGKSMFQMSLFWSFQEWWGLLTRLDVIDACCKKLFDGRENPENTEVPGSVDFTKPFLAWWVSCHRPLCGVYFSFGSLVMRGQGPALWKSPKNQSFFFVLTSLSASFVEIFIYIIGVLIGRSDLSVSSNPWCLPRNFEEIQSALVTTQEAKTVSFFSFRSAPERPGWTEIAKPCKGF